MAVWRGDVGYDMSDLVNRHKDLVYHAITRMVPESQHHDDLFQETFLNVARGLPAFRRESKLSTWIYRVAQNTCLSHIRRVRRDPFYSSEVWFEEDICDLTPPSGDNIEAEEARTSLEGALSRLPLKYRMPIVLYYLEEMSYKEIAACLSMPMGTVKTNIHRGLLRLRRELGEDSDVHV